MGGRSRQLGVELTQQEGLIRQYYGWIGLRVTGGNMQMHLLEPPNVAGWPAYYQQPGYHELWLNSDTLNSRVKFLDEILNDRYQIAVQTYYHTAFDPTVLAAVSSDPSNANTLVADWVNLLYANPLSA